MEVASRCWSNVRLRLVVLAVLVMGVAGVVLGVFAFRGSVPPVPAGDGVVIGGIAPCEALPIANEPTYAAGTVTVYRGHETWRATGPGTSVVVFPPAVAARETVDENSTYRFVLPAGPYVLSARYVGGPSTDGPFIDVIVRAGTTRHVDIPDTCI